MDELCRSDGARKFGERLRRMRSVRGLAQRDLACWVGVSKSAIHRYEAGRYPDADVAARMAYALGCELSYLLVGEPVPTDAMVVE